MTMISPLCHDDLAARIKEKGIPVLLLDTCSILDIVRAPVREQISVRDIEAVHTLLDRTIGLNRQVSLVVTKQVFTEFQEHLDEVTQECDRHIIKASENHIGILERMKALSPSSVNLLPAVDLASFGFPEKSRCLAEKIVTASLVLNDETDELRSKAYRRSAGAKPPAKKGKDSIKDCLIIESYFRLGRILKNNKLPCRIVFITSNKHDYEKSSHLHPDLKEEFNSVDLEYSPNWSAARHKLDR